MDLSSLHKRVLPCDVNSPYVFISYSSNDKEIVLKDVIELQDRGYNLWLDVANIDKTKPSWEDDALKAIESSNCVLLAFYVSRNSLVSEACLNEIAMTEAESTIETHLEKVCFFAVECEYINDIGDFIRALHSRISSSDLERDKKDYTLRVLSRFSQKWFPMNNKKIRIHPQNQENRLSYYEDIENELCRHQRNAKFSPEKLYRFAINCILNKDKNDIVIKLLSLGANIYNYSPSALMLAHYERVYNNNEERACQLWRSVGEEVPSTKWKEWGEKEKEKKCYFEAVAWLMAYGEKYEDPDALFKASQIWTMIGSKEQTINTLKLAASKGCEKAIINLPKLQQISEEEFRKISEKYKKKE